MLDTQEKREDFIRRVVQMKDEAARLGLWQTMHAFDHVTEAFGCDNGSTYRRLSK